MREKVKLYLNKCHYATIWLNEIKSMEQNGAYWYIKMKDGNVWEDCNMAVITHDQNEKIGYWINK